MHIVTGRKDSYVVVSHDECTLIEGGRRPFLLLAQHDSHARALFNVETALSEMIHGGLPSPTKVCSSK